MSTQRIRAEIDAKIYDGRDDPTLGLLEYIPFLTGPVAVLLLTGPTPGLVGTVNTLDVSGATPGATIYFVHGFQDGSTAVPGCPGATVDIKNPKLTGSDVADGSGQASLSGFVPNGASGKTVLLQAVEHASCTVSNLVEHTFP
ncbi:MAG: hypothetical protein HY347_07280 [candidate division NC10 bacterium]|nr:hypothetical protein [candidate division NC10 bacterium]